jgi:hypothetical protein
MTKVEEMTTKEWTLVAAFKNKHGITKPVVSAKFELGKCIRVELHPGPYSPFFYEKGNTNEQ